MHFLCVETDKTALLHPNGGRQIGIDVGLKAFYSDSNGNTVANPRPLKSLQRKLRREQRRLSRKMPKSRNREKARICVARLHERIANIRRDFLHKLSTRLARENQTVAVEHLNIKGMLRNVGHTGIHAWENRVRRQFFGGGAVVVEPRIPCLSGMGNVNFLRGWRRGIPCRSGRASSRRRP